MKQPSQHLQRLQARQAHTSNSGQTGSPSIVREVLASSGQPLDPATRAFMEPRFGHDFSWVRVHTDAKAAESAWAVNARAYTVGNDVVFRGNEYAPNTGRGRRLLAHELAHTIQQRIATGRSPSPDPHGIFESNADNAARDVADGRAVSRDFPACGIGLARAPAEREALDRAAAVAEAEAVIARLGHEHHDQDDEPAAKPAVHRNEAQPKFSPGGFTDDVYDEYIKTLVRDEEQMRRRVVLTTSVGEFYLQGLTPEELRTEAAVVAGALDAPTLSHIDRQLLELNLQTLEDYASAQGVELAAATAYRLRQVVTALAIDSQGLGSELKKILRTEVWGGEVGGDYPFQPFRPEANWVIQQLSWVTDAMSEAIGLTAAAEAGGAQSTQQFRAAGTRVMAALFGSQAVAIHLAYLHAGVVAASDFIGPGGVIESKVRRVREELEPMLQELRSLDPVRVERAVTELQSPWRSFQADFSSFVEALEEHAHTLKRIRQVVGIIELAMLARGLMGPRPGGGPPIAGGPGIGGVTAGGVAVAGGAVGSVEWLEAMRRLAAVGAISTAAAVGRIGGGTAGKLPMPAKPTLTAAAQIKPKDPKGGGKKQVAPTPKKEGAPTKPAPKAETAKAEDIAGQKQQGVAKDVTAAQSSAPKAVSDDLHRLLSQSDNTSDGLMSVVNKALHWQSKRGGHKVYITEGGQLVGDHKSLKLFVKSNKTYKNWNSHHIIEEIHLKNVGIRHHFPSRNDLPCVLLPEGGHMGRVGRMLKGANNKVNLSPAELYSDYYSKSYEMLGAYTGIGTAQQIRAELSAVVKRMLGFTR